jgi:hypothetical protein
MFSVPASETIVLMASSNESNGILNGKEEELPLVDSQIPFDLWQWSPQGLGG